MVIALHQKSADSLIVFIIRLSAVFSSKPFNSTSRKLPLVNTRFRCVAVGQDYLDFLLKVAANLSTPDHFGHGMAWWYQAYKKDQSVKKGGITKLRRVLPRLRG